MDGEQLPLVVEVTGLLQDPAFHVAKCAAEALKLKFPSKFADPVIRPLFEFAWNEYLQEKKKELRGEMWAYSSHVMCFVNGWLLGDQEELLRWAYCEWDYCDFKPEALYQVITEDFYAKYLKSTQHVFVYLKIAIEEQPIGTLLFELFSDACPKTCENFRALCVGGLMSPFSGRELTYKNSSFHLVIKSVWIQGGDITGKGDGGESIYGPTFEDFLDLKQLFRLGHSTGITVSGSATVDEGHGFTPNFAHMRLDERPLGKKEKDENFSIPHKGRGVLGMANRGRHSNGSQFYITLQAIPFLDKKCVAFGQLVEGTEVLQRLEDVPTYKEMPTVTCKIMDCGTFQP